MRRKAEQRGHIRYADPLQAGRHPFQTYLLTLCLISAVPLLFGITPTSIQAELPRWLVIPWGTMLLTGAGSALVGSHWRGNYANALTIERSGLAIVGMPALVFATAIIMYAGWHGLVSAALTAGFGLSCLRRSSDIGGIIKRALTPDAETAPIETEPEDFDETEGLV